ncbi:AbrB/MazE/SpoVT family DNA-binding domain-containing protein [Candidatus Roizmanbacteria bacterium]|nr:AbrB/MazE/SpoVT family DNA-binding domain-containing protein [Candidatus Roizmanbacteria bacterium]
MAQKIIKVGNSAAIIIPKTLLQEVGLNIGNSVVVEKDITNQAFTISKKGSISTSSITPRFLAIVDRVNKRYGPALKELAQKHL